MHFVGLQPDQAVEQETFASLPPGMQAALDAQGELRSALLQSELPVRFSAMVLGLAALRQGNENRRRR